MSEPRRIDDTLWEIPASARPDMRVPARVFPQLFRRALLGQKIEWHCRVTYAPLRYSCAQAVPRRTRPGEPHRHSPGTWDGQRQMPARGRPARGILPVNRARCRRPGAS